MAWTGGLVDLAMSCLLSPVTMIAIACAAMILVMRGGKDGRGSDAP